MPRLRHSRCARAFLLVPAVLPLCLAAIACPAEAGMPKASNDNPTRAPGRSGVSVLSGTLIRQSQATTTWLLYPGACNDRAAGTWSPRSSPVADSLNTYNTTSQNHGYTLVDQSLKEHLWHIDDGTTKVGTFPLPIDGSRSLWCGKTNPGWAVQSGYPNETYQILYVDTDIRAAQGGGARSTNYNLSWYQYASTDLGFDRLYIIGGGYAAKDTLGNNRALFDQIIENGLSGDSELLAIFTGSQTVNQSLSYVPEGVLVTGSASGSPSTCTISITGIPPKHRAIYFVFISDFRNSPADGLWPSGHGIVLDLLSTSDEGSLYSDQTTAGGTDAFQGDVLVGTAANPLISARSPSGVGTLWQIASGSTLPTGDYCAPGKGLASDIEFLGGDPFSLLTVPNSFASVATCTFPVPAGTGQVSASWSEYVDLPRGSGYVQYAEYRVFRNAAWSEWKPTSPGAVKLWAPQSWTTDGADLTEAARADSVQVRFTLRCYNALAIDYTNCTPVTYGVLYDDFRLQATSGVPAPSFRIFPGSLAQTTFVNGLDAPLDGSCTSGQISAGQCWPGIRGSGLPAGIAIHDNVNSPEGDSIVVSILSGLRPNGMGINWLRGFDKSVSAGLTIAYTNASFNPAYDLPRIIFRLYDPSTKSWSPWDSSGLDADAVALSGPDTVVVDGGFRMNWPPRDKVASSASLPGGFAINGVTLYSQLAFLPRGCRLQYYLKAVDINGGVVYQFSSDYPGLEVQDLPMLPGSSIQAPDIIEFDVLPGVYPPGAAGTLLAGKVGTPVLNLDGRYSGWSYGVDPVTQALRALGVRADRYRLLQGLGEGANFGGHELPGQRVDRPGNYFPNLTEYPILTKLAGLYRIIIQSSHLRTWTVFEEQDAQLLHDWWNADTGTDGGDRCVFASGDDMFNALLNSSAAFPQHAEQVSLAQDVFGVSSCIPAWTGWNTTLYPTIADTFAGITYPLDGGCPDPNRFDGLTKVGSPDATVAASYPGGASELAGVARSSENDAVPDNDRSKALAYAFSIQFMRTAGIPTTAPNYVHTGVENRMRVLFKFLTSCRGARTPDMMTVCWPCPSSYTDLTANWATATGFDTPDAGPLYPIQDNTQATGVPDEGPAVPAFVNSLSQNRPNPFNPETVIPYSLASDGKVVIRIYDVAGRLVRTLVNAAQPAGPHVARWNGRAEGGRVLASGVYFYRIEYPGGSFSAKKLTILR